MFLRYGLPLLLVALLLVGCDNVTGGTQIEELETQNAQLQATIAELGTPVMTITALQGMATQNQSLQIEISNQQGTARAAEATLSVLQGGGGVVLGPPTNTPISAPPGDGPPPLSTATPTQQPAQTAAVTLTPVNSGVTFTNTVMATDRDSEDCPVGITTSFDANAEAIYIITRISTLRTGWILGARWYVNERLFLDDVRCWVPDEDWTNICAWCSIVPDEAGFETGAWRVEMFLNGQEMAEASFDVINAVEEE